MTTLAVDATELDYLRYLEQLEAEEAEHAAQAAAEKALLYLHDAAGWARDCINWPKGQSLAPYQAETMRELTDRKRVAKRGPHGLGKSTEMALLVLWFALTRDLAGIDWKVITTASVWRQLDVYLWPEIHKWAARIRWDVVGREPFKARAELLDLRLKLQYGAATAVASNQPERIEGAHADHILYILDEAKIIPVATWDAIEGALSNAGSDTQYEAYVVAMSTPGAPSGRFYDIHQKRPGYEDWWVRHVTLAEAIAAGRISREWADQRRRQWGENSAMYQGRVLGQFHSSDDDSVIPLSWVDAAVERWYEQARTKEPLTGRKWTGVDVARGGDKSVLAERTGYHIRLHVIDTRDTMEVVEKVRKLPGRPVVDVIGVGSGVYDRLRQLRAQPVAYTGSEESFLRDRSGEFRFVNTRSAAYWRLRELLDPEYDSQVCLPPDDLLASDLTAPTWETTERGGSRIKIETKEDVVKRLNRSPDRGDATVMAFYADASHTPAKAITPTGTLPATTLSPLSRR